jgi:hypothetical protein
MALLEDFTYTQNGNVISFDGNTNLRGKNTKLPWSKEHLAEWMKCSNDIHYFAENYYYILNLDEGMQKVKLRDYQEDLITKFNDNRFNIVLASRQCGKSTSFEIFVCWYILFNKDKKVAILANKAEQSKDLLRKIKQAYELLPKWLQQGVKSWNASSIQLENGCSVIASSTSSTAIRGRSISLLIIDEMGFVPRNIWEDFYSSVYPTISSGKSSKVIFVSTPHGLNHFYQFWNESEQSINHFTNTRVDWWQVPGRDAKWKEETIANIGLVKFNQEYGNEFLGSAYTLLESSIIKELQTKYVQKQEDTILFEKIEKKYHRYISIYEEPVLGRTYSMGVDSAKMTEDKNGDNITIQILDITKLPYKQVCSVNISEGFNYLQLPQMCYTIGKYFNNAYAFIENNEIGQVVANSLNYDYEYDNVFFERPDTPGFRTTKKTKRLGFNNLKILLENNKLIIRDFNTIAELSTFVKYKESYRAEAGYNDDLVMALISSLFFIQRSEYESFEDTKQMLQQVMYNKENEMQEDLPSFGFTYDSIESPEFDFNP